MTPKEKAIELVGKYNNSIMSFLSDNMKYQNAIKCALIAVDEIIKSRKEDKSFNDYLSATGSEYYTPHPMYLTYWEEVKQELENLKNK